MREIEPLDEKKPGFFEDEKYNNGSYFIAMFIFGLMLGMGLVLFTERDCIFEKEIKCQTKNQ